MRLEMLGGAINTASYNNALQEAAPVYGMQYFKMAGPHPKCEYCIKYYGRIYRQGMFMPEFLRIQIVFTSGMFGFLGKKSQSSQHSGTNTSNLNNSVNIALSNRILQNRPRSNTTEKVKKLIEGTTFQA